MDLSGRRQRRRPKRRFIDVVREDMQIVDGRVENEEGRETWWRTIHRCES